VFIAADGRVEAGQDVGGLFKELWTSLSAVAFDPSYGLMAQTKSGELHPNHLARSLHGDRARSLLAFLGRVLGKAVYEGIVIQPKFARFFLKKMLGRYNSLNDLRSLDEELYKNLMFLKGYDGDAADLCLDFTVTEDLLGKQRDVPLIPGGASVDVTTENKIKYVFAVANYHMNVRDRDLTAAFLGGFREMIDVDLLRMFSESELQRLISGEDKPLDVNDLRAHTVYHGGYASLSPSIRRFWRVVKSLDVPHQKLLLKFVTSCERTPRLGFGSLQPPFSIVRVSDTSRLPAAATCFNRLKLPAYSSEKKLKEKLIRAITSNCGFEMT